MFTWFNKIIYFSVRLYESCIDFSRIIRQSDGKTETDIIQSKILVPVHSSSY